MSRVTLKNGDRVDHDELARILARIRSLSRHLPASLEALIAACRDPSKRYPTGPPPGLESMGVTLGHDNHLVIKPILRSIVVSAYPGSRRAISDPRVTNRLTLMPLRRGDTQPEMLIGMVETALAELNQLNPGTVRQVYWAANTPNIRISSAYRQWLFDKFLITRINPDGTVEISPANRQIILSAVHLKGTDVTLVNPRRIVW